jgi:hypothetical protein
MFYSLASSPLYIYVVIQSAAKDLLPMPYAIALATGSMRRAKRVANRDDCVAATHAAVTRHRRTTPCANGINPGCDSRRSKVACRGTPIFGGRRLSPPFSRRAPPWILRIRIHGRRVF